MISDELSIKSEVWRGPLVMVWPNGKRTTTERKVTTVTDWRETPIGPINFGYVQLGPQHWVEIE